MCVQQLIGAQTIGGLQAWLRRLRLEIATAIDGEVSILVEGSSILITIDTPAVYAGHYSVSLDQFSTGPVNLVPPRIVGEPIAGDALTSVPGLWVYRESDGTPTASYKWVRSDVSIAGATADSYVVSTADSGAALGIVETVSGSFDTRTAISETVSVPGVSPLASLSNVAFVLMPGSEHGICYQEISGAAATTPCADGDPVGTYADLLTGKFATAPDLASRPVYRSSGGKAWLELSRDGQRLELPLDLSASDEITVVAGARKAVGSADFEILAELTGAVGLNNGSFALAQPSGGNGWTTIARGTVQQTAETTAGFPPGQKDVVSAQAKIGAASIVTRINGGEVARSTADLGSGNFANEVLHIGSRGTRATRSFIGDLYALVLRPALSSDAELKLLETLVSDQMGQ